MIECGLAYRSCLFPRAAPVILFEAIFRELCFEPHTRDSTISATGIELVQTTKDNARALRRRPDEWKTSIRSVLALANSDSVPRACGSARRRAGAASIGRLRHHEKHARGMARLTPEARAEVERLEKTRAGSQFGWQYGDALSTCITRWADARNAVDAGARTRQSAVT